MCVIDLEPCSVWVETPRVARVQHHCSSCRGPILPGQAYMVNFSVFDGYGRSTKGCFLCWLAREEFSDAHDAMSNFDDFPHLLNECIDENERSREPGERWLWMRRLLGISAGLRWAAIQ